MRDTTRTVAADDVAAAWLDTHAGCLARTATTPGVDPLLAAHARMLARLFRAAADRPEPSPNPAEPLETP